MTVIKKNTTKETIQNETNSLGADSWRSHL